MKTRLLRRLRKVSRKHYQIEHFYNTLFILNRRLFKTFSYRGEALAFQREQRRLLILNILHNKWKLRLQKFMVGIGR